MAWHDWATLIGHYGYWAIFALSLLEGPLITVFAAALAAQGLLKLDVVYGVVLAGDLGGDLAYYAAGRWLLAPLMRYRKTGRHRLADRVAALRARLHEHCGRILLLGKLTHSAGFVILLACGAARVRLLPYLSYNLLGTLPKAALLMAVGYYYGRLYTGLSLPLKMLSALVFVLVLGGLLWWAQRLGAREQVAGET